MKFVGFYDNGVRVVLPICVVREQNCYKTQSGAARFRAVAPKLFGARNQFHGRQFFVDQGMGRGMVSGCFKCITLTVCFISIIITSGPPQIIRHYHILEIGDPWFSEF